MDTVSKYAKLLENSGYKVRLPKNGDRSISYLSGTDAERADELNAAIRDPEVRAIMPCRGGYGLTRILDRIDYAALRKDPKIITGFSDLTALHLAAARQARLITFHSPMPMVKLWNEDKPYDFAAASFRRAVFAASYPKGEIGYRIALPDRGPGLVRLVGGKAKGRLVGGNLTLICATLGTPYEIEAKGNILFFEDVDEPPYRIDRYLSQLRLAGILDSVSGVVVGGFSVKTPKDGEAIEALGELPRQEQGPRAPEVPCGTPGRQRDVAARRDGRARRRPGNLDAAGKSRPRRMIDDAHFADSAAIVAIRLRSLTTFPLPSGCTRFVKMMTAMRVGGSIQIDVPVKPVCPKPAVFEKTSPRFLE